MLTRHQLDGAVENNIISSDQAKQLLEYFLSKSESSAGDNLSPSFDFTHLLYYFGGTVAIGAMSIFMNLGWEEFGGWGIFFISFAYMSVGLKLTQHFQVKGFSIPAGICATFAVALTPLAIYGLQQAMGWWPDTSAYRDYHRYIQWHWLYMELGTLIVGIALARLYKYPFMLMPIAITLWYLSMDLVIMLSYDGKHSWDLRTIVSLYFGLAMIGIALWVDIRTRHLNKSAGDYSFWLYLFGVMTFWGGLSAQHSDSELNKLIYFCINMLMMASGIVLMRRVFVIFGALGASFYLAHLADHIFKDSWLFPITLCAIGLGIMYLGIIWQKHEYIWTQKLRVYLPQAIQELLASKNKAL